MVGQALLHFALYQVGIAARQTGLYPCDAPGGWRLIGRSPVHVFDLARTPPFLVRPGDMVRFEAIDAAAYTHMAAAG